MTVPEQAGPPELPQRAQTHGIPVRPRDGLSISGRLIIVVKANMVPMAQELVARLDPQGAAATFDVPLRSRAGTTVVGYWCSIAVTDAQRADLYGEVVRRAQTPLEPIYVPPGETMVTPWNRARLWVFQADDGAWNSQSVLDTLGLAVMTTGSEL